MSNGDDFARGKQEATLDTVQDTLDWMRNDIKEFQKENHDAHEKIHKRIDYLWVFLAATGGLAILAAQLIK
jgi:gas vesicle protein